MSFNLSEKLSNPSNRMTNKLVVLGIGDVKEFIKRLKEKLESEKYRDDEYPAHQSFIRVEIAQKELGDECISHIIDKLAGETLI